MHDFRQLNLDEQILELLGENKLCKPTEVQLACIPHVLKNRDILAMAQTGSGKTLAFTLPILDMLLKRDRPYFCIIMTPTRELALQITSTLVMFESLGLRTCTLIGGDSFSKQASKLMSQPHIIIGTPGRITEHISKTKHFKISKVKKIVLDEADRFCDRDFDNEQKLIFESIHRRHQTLLFTATVGKSISELMKHLKKPKIVKIGETYNTVNTLEEQYAFVPYKHKVSALYSFLSSRTESSGIIFVSMCISSQILAKVLQLLNISAESLNGALSQGRREEILDGFRFKKIQFLVSTDVGSRGLDIPHVDFIINYDVPTVAKDYIHRVGRTARAGRSGYALTFVTQYDIETYQKLEYILKRKLDAFKFDINGLKLKEEKISNAEEEAKGLLKECNKTKRKIRKQ